MRGKKDSRAGGGAIDIRKAINIDVPVERVFEFWANYENFPRFMSNVREVKDLGDGRSHWKVAGPAGVPIEWDAEITKLTPNKVLAWKSEPDSTVEHSGTVRFKPNSDGGTQVDIKMSYSPPAGVVGRAVAKLLGSDPDAKMDKDLKRLKKFIEAENPTRRAAKKPRSKRGK